MHPHIETVYFVLFDNNKIIKKEGEELSRISTQPKMSKENSLLVIAVATSVRVFQLPFKTADSLIRPAADASVDNGCC